MKKYYILILTLVASLGLSACQDRLDLRSNGTIDMSQVFKDRNRTKGYLNACYSYVLSYDLYADSFSDNAQNSMSAQAGNKYDVWYNQGVTASNFGTYNVDGDPWASLYQGIRKCNVFLANIGSATGEMTESERAGWTSQAYTLRAYYYLQLVKRYGQCPLILEDLGTTHDYSVDTKATVADLTKQIVADCEKALETPDCEDYSYSYTSGQYGIMNKAIAQAVKVEAVMWAISPLLSDGYSKEDALAVAADGLAALLKNDYSLWTATGAGVNAYATYHLTNPNDMRAADKETIYGSGQVAVWSACGIPVVAGITSAGACPTQELVDAYEMANGQVAITGYNDSKHLEPVINSASGYNDKKPYVNRDPRFYATVWYYGSKRGSVTINTKNGGSCSIKSNDVKYTMTGYYLRKYANDLSNKNSNADGYLRRMTLAEVYYNFAEVALAANGADTKVGGVNLSARDAVNKVRSRAGMPDIASGLSNADFEKRYQNDRRVELAFTGDRLFSVRRWKTLSASSVVSGMTSDCERFAFDARPTTADKYLLYPINQTESNKIVTITGGSWQNPGWE